MSFRKSWDMPFRKLNLPFTLTDYIHTEKYSPKSYVVTFHTQMSSSQSEERTMAFTREINYTSNKNRERCLFRCEKSGTSNQRSQRFVSLAPKFPPFIGSCRSFLALQLSLRQDNRSDPIVVDRIWVVVRLYRLQEPRKLLELQNWKPRQPLSRNVNC